MKGRLIHHKGESLTKAEWARRYKMNYGTVDHRISMGWDFEKALTTPPSSVYQKTSVSKTDGERYLNDLPRDKWPEQLVKITPTYNGPALGQYLRRYHIKAFNEWFANVYSRNPAGSG